MTFAKELLKIHEKVRKFVPRSTIPRKSLDLLFCILSVSFVPLRISGSELTSSTAMAIASFAIFPTTESKVIIAPMFTTSGLAATLVPSALEEEALWKTINSRSKAMIMVDSTLRKDSKTA